MNEISEDEYNRASQGIEALLAVDLQRAVQEFDSSESPLDQLCLGAAVLLQLCLCFKDVNIQQGSDALKRAEEELSRRRKSAAAATKTTNSASRFPPGLEWEILHAYVVVLQAMFHTISHSYYGFLQAIYDINSAHSKFVKLHKTVFPNGMGQRVPGKTENQDSTQSADTLSPPSTPLTPSFGLFSRIIGFRNRESTTPSQPEDESRNEKQELDGFREEMIVCGTAFGFGLFSLIVSFLPPKARSIAGIFGYKSDRKAALKALSFAASASNTMTDPFALLSGLEARYPAGLLWVVSKAQIFHATGRSEEAISLLEGVLATSTNGIKLNTTKPKGVGQPYRIFQLDQMMLSEYVWFLMAQGRYSDAATGFCELLRLHGTSRNLLRLMIVGCYLRAGQRDLAQTTLEQMVTSIEKRKKEGQKSDGNSIPTVFVNHWMELWQGKRARRGEETKLVDVIAVNPIDELTIVWDNVYRMTNDNVLAGVRELCTYTPYLNGDQSMAQLDPLPEQHEAGDSFEDLAESNVNLDTPDERASRLLMLGALYGTRDEFDPARRCLRQSMEEETVWIKTWISPLAAYEQAVLELREADLGDTRAKEGEQETTQMQKERWRKAILSATSYLDRCATLVAGTPLAGRMESKVDLTKEEIAQRRSMMGL